MRVLAGFIDRALGALTSAAGWLALPIAAALFLQWPLRDIVRCCSREANDIGQWLFALYIAIAVTAATRSGAHLAADALSRRYAPAFRRRLGIAAALLVALPFAALTLALAWPQALASVLRLETFGDTGNPGYFIIRSSVPLMAALLGLQAVVEIVGRSDPKDGRSP